MINNLKEFFEARGFGMDKGEMYSYGRALYKYSFGPWTSYLVEDAPESTSDFRIEVRHGPKMEACFSYSDLPEKVKDFFNVDDGNKFLFEEYVALIITFKKEHNVAWDYTYHKEKMLLIIEGTHTEPATIREVYYDSAQGKNETLALADKVVGIKIGSIIEGAHYDAEPFTMMFPFSESEYDSNMEELRMEVEAGWEEANSEEEEV